MSATELLTAADRIKISAQHLELVRILAAKLFRLRWGDEIPFDDYYQSGVVGLLEAAKRFEPGRGIKFSTFASPRITGSILNGLVHASEAFEQSSARKRLLAQRIAAITEMGPDSTADSDPFVRIAEAAIGLAIGFLLEDTGMYQSAENSFHCDAYRTTALQQTGHQLRRAMNTLTQREREIMERHYYAHMSFEEISKDLGITKGRISQLHAKALQRLRGILSDNTFHDFEA